MQFTNYKNYFGESCQIDVENTPKGKSAVNLFDVVCSQIVCWEVKLNNCIPWLGGGLSQK